MSDFYAKYYGDYNITSTEVTNNVTQTYYYLSGFGFSKESIIGICGNIYAESGFNPWLWDQNVVDYNYKAYGLVQFYPGGDYINATGIPNHAPSLSTSGPTPGADPDDAKGQLYCVVNDTFGKWVDTCWRTYWSAAAYPILYAQAQHILSTYGSGGRLSLNQFKTIDNYPDACLAFLACYEGPGDPNYSTRLNYCNILKVIINALDVNTNILFLKKIIDNNFNPLGL